MAPSWRLLAKFGEEVEFPGPLLTTQVCPCSYCWCGKCGTQRLPPQSVFRSLFSAEAREALLETLGGDDLLTGGEGESEGSALTSLTETGVNDDQDLMRSSSGPSDVKESSAASKETRQTPESSAQLDEGLQASTLDSEDAPFVDSAAISDSATTEESSEDEDDQSSSALLSDLSGGETMNFTRQNDSINSTANFSFQRKIKAMQSTFLFVRISQRAAKFECDHCERTFVRNSSFVAHVATHASPLQNQPTSELGDTFQRVAMYTDDLANDSRSSRRSEVVGHQRNSLASLSGFEFHRRLSALQSTFMDLNVSASNGSQPQEPRTTISTTSETSIGTSSDSVSHQQKLKRRLLCKQSRLLIQKQVLTFNCSYCKRSFMKRGNLIIHMRKHLEIRPFRCTFGQCRRQFTRATALEAHARTAHFEETSLSFSTAGSISNTHENSKRRSDYQRSQKSEKAEADKLQGDRKNKNLVARVDTSLINQQSLQNTWSNAKDVKNVVPAGGEPLKNLIRSAGPVERQGSQRVEDPAGRLPVDTVVEYQVYVDQDEDAPVGEISQSAASSKTPKLGTSSGSSASAVDSRGCLTAHKPTDVNFVPVCTSDTTKPGLSEEIPNFSLGPMMHEIVFEADETETRDSFDRTEAGSDSIFDEASPADVCVNCNKTLAKKQAEHENSTTSHGKYQEVSEPLMYCPDCKTCQINLPNTASTAFEDPVQPIDDSVDGEESTESSDDGDNADDPVWNDPETETEDSEESTDDDGDSDDDDNAAAASTHELSVIPEEHKENQSDDDEQTKSVPGQSRQQNVGKKVPNEKPGKRKFCCVECGEGFSGRKALNLHLLEHDPVLPFKCGLCTARFESRKKHLIHHKTHKDETGRFNCNQCEYSTQYSSHIVTHLRVHSGQKLYTCNICGKEFNQLSNLKKHKRVHNGERPYKCDVCKKTFSYANVLKDHKRVHNGERPYKCDVCKTAFKQHNALKYHKRLHSGERPYKCDVCKKAFKLFHHLQDHKRLHSGERPYKCDVCKEAFKQSNALEYHKRIHSGERPYECDVCKQTFTQSNSLKSHKRVHSGERPYKCDVCKMAFKQPNALKDHKRVHSGERPYECSKCSRSFTQKSSLQRHQKSVHRKNRAKKQCDSP